MKRDYYPDLNAALDHWKIPLENRPLIREVVADLDARQGIKTLWYRTISYAGGERYGSLPHLEFSWGYLTGLTEEEARPYGSLAYATTRQNKAGRDGAVWGIELPVHKPRTTGVTPARSAAQAKPKVCQKCFMELPLAGPCECES